MAADYPDIDIAPYIDHSLLIPTATTEQVEQWCEQADRFHFAAVCVYPAHVRFAAEYLYGKKPKVCTVIGFPTGATTSAVKLYEAQEAVENGATELDVVINLGWLKAGKTDEVHREIAEICEETGQTVKVILETNLLTDAEKRLAAEICMDAGAAFLKTSTGWNGGATVADVRLLKEVAKEAVGIKASGGIRSIDQALDLILAGATRLGTSRGVDLLRQRDTLEKRE
ncbi:deoxyribose-phosphate aldolase [Chlorogloeopsis fritschii PCC 9212]|jgi:deoxyribose-phosphate aldolase|uniref:Deoxyribose-phosphate aldolase n=1 Tax=Chlorogloeopsis fritschii PCC 6912 TaxID=211165 RepID=A0A433NDH6_CHLFR|nr:MULTISPECIES: deoxyribose-phosphate aldolase [Chlorogloeopsis]MBF2007020.1 deoxyribose-phosphate aldolase [Chlorogloeopsis fritschii C42_A2020_084]MDM9379272.1 deoxyribose-phosphate aldolase [Chlorogloeopsis sp. ULAP01]RUR80154.1 deoxyribose-phosphate aldolase [Chlorogloeopsis fritschii PCC 6912]